MIVRLTLSELGIGGRNQVHDRGHSHSYRTDSEAEHHRSAPLSAGLTSSSSVFPAKLLEQLHLPICIHRPAKFPVNLRQLEMGGFRQRASLFDGDHPAQIRLGGLRIS